MNIKHRTSFVVAALVGIAQSGMALGAPGYTLIKNSGSYEQQTLAQVFGGTWTKGANGLDYAGNGMTATRLADAGVATPTSLTTGVSGTDNAWMGPASVQVTFRAKEAGEHFQFGYFDDTASDHAYHEIFNTAHLTGPVAVTFPSSFRFAYREVGDQTFMSSRSSDNTKKGVAYDQVITYRVTGGSVDEWIMFWEDHPHRPGTTQFDDMVVSIGAAVPTPASAGLIGLGALGAARRRRK